MGRELLAGGADQVLVGLSVGQLDSPYAAKVVQVPRDLVVGGVWRKSCLRNDVFARLGSPTENTPRAAYVFVLSLQTITKHRRMRLLTA
jgi:hypothetical protein